MRSTVWFCLTVVLGPSFFNSSSLAQESTNDLVFKELAEKHSQYAKKWNEGYISVRVEGIDGTANIAAWWVEDRSRREIDDRGLDGFRTASECILVVNPQTYCRFSKAILLANCERRISYPKIVSSYRVLPTEAWMEIAPGISLFEWLKQCLSRSDNTKGARLLKVGEGYTAVLGSKEAVEMFSDALESGKPRPTISAGEYVTSVNFNSHGLLLSNEYWGHAPSNTILYMNEWTDDEVPMPRTLLRKYRTDSSAEYSVMLKLSVENVGNKLPPKAPSMSVPPTDLPFGSAVVDKTKNVLSTTFVGGEEGRAHHLLLKSGLQVKRDVNN